MTLTKWFITVVALVFVSACQTTNLPDGVAETKPSAQLFDEDTIPGLDIKVKRLVSHYCQLNWHRGDANLGQRKNITDIDVQDIDYAKFHWIRAMIATQGTILPVFINSRNNFIVCSEKSFNRRFTHSGYVFHETVVDFETNEGKPWKH